MIVALCKVIKRMHYPLELMLTCVRWYAAYPLGLRHIEERMAGRGVGVDHATVHRWAIKILPVLATVFRFFVSACDAERSSCMIEHLWLEYARAP